MNDPFLQPTIEEPRKTILLAYVGLLAGLACAESAGAAVRYVNVNSTNAAPPYTNWATAAIVIQDAVDAASAGDEIVVTNGVYATGGHAVYPGMTNRVAVTKPLTLRSVNGPDVTVIRGYQVPGTTNGDGAVRCVYLANGAILVGFTLTSGAAVEGGGGVWCESPSATVSNCVLIGNAARSGGGAFWGTLDECRLDSNVATDWGGGAWRSILNRCVLTDNSADQGGAAFNASLNQCTIAENTAALGGGVSRCTLDRCIVSGNIATRGGFGTGGGGALSSSLTNCLLFGNAAQSGGGAYASSLLNCTVVGNTAAVEGGGLWAWAWSQGCSGIGCSDLDCSLARCHFGQSRVVNCIIYDNNAPTGANHLGFIGSPPMPGSELPPPSSIGYSCTTPLPNGVFGNITNAPLFVDAAAGNFSLQSNSPCINAGRNADAPAGHDLEGNLRIWGTVGTVDMGAYEFQATGIGPLAIAVEASHTNISVGFEITLSAQISGYPTATHWEFGDGTVLSNQLVATHRWQAPGNYTVMVRALNESNPEGVSAIIVVQVETGPLDVSVAAAFTNVGTGFEVSFTGQILGGVGAFAWEFGDGTTVSNRLNITHSWVAPGDYAVVLRAYNQSFPNGISATTLVHVVEQPVHYVVAIGSNPVPPYTSWATAASTIQDAVDAAAAGGVVVVTNGVYQTGGRVVHGTLTNRVAVMRPLTLRSVNGPDVTIIRGHQVPGSTNGDGAVRCVYLTNGVTLVGFTLTNGGTRATEWGENVGGGVWSEPTGVVVSNCVLIGNSAFTYGGGAYGGAFRNCTFIANSARAGGGASQATLNNCILATNRAQFGGGAAYSILSDCTLNLNVAEDGGGVAGCDLNHCTLTGNSAIGVVGVYGGSGGGAWASSLNACTLIGNSGTFDGGGALGGTLNNCLLTRNTAQYGGGAYNAILNNCTVVGNSASVEAGGADYGTLNNCVVYYNTARGGEHSFITMNHCCTTRLPQFGQGNITLAPLFVDRAAGNFRLQSNSPCINAGRNSYGPSGFDLDGNPRIVGGTVDIGAYEFQTPLSSISYAWLAQYRLPADGSADLDDPDGDGHNNREEWRAWTNPTNSASALRLLAPIADTNGIQVRWQSVHGQNYFLERSASLGALLDFATVATGLVGQPGWTAYADTNAAGTGPYFYRVGVWE